jgi:hypothetical protein
MANSRRAWRRESVKEIKTMTTAEQIPSVKNPDQRGRGSSRFVGVSWTNKDKRWVAHITCNGQQKNLGHFKDEVEAAKTYDKAAREAFGKWATLNFPTDAERAFASQWYDRDRACQFFGVTRHVFKRWVREGKITGGRVVPSSRGGGKRRVFTLGELKRLKQEMFGDDKLYKDGKTGVYHVPEGFLRREDACSRFGVSIQVWWRWERQGLISCGMRIPGGPKLYRVEDIERLVEKHGVLSPPYPDPDRPGVYRVPLGSHGITRREAIIDAESLPLIEGGSCSWGLAVDDVGYVALCHPKWPKGTPLRRVIMGVVGSEMNVGHNNGDPLDCRRENLNVKTVRQRVRGNRKSSMINGKPPSSQFKGVFWDTWAGKWRARICVGEKNHSLGRFHDEIEAAEMYDFAARKYFGIHAWLNFPKEGERGFTGINVHSAECEDNRRPKTRLAA